MVLCHRPSGFVSQSQRTACRLRCRRHRRKKTIEWGKTEGNSKNQAAGYRHWSWAKLRKGKNDQALNYAQKGLKIAQTLGDEHEEAACGRAASIAFVRQGHYAHSAAETAYRRALPLWESLQRPQRGIDARAGLVRTAVLQKNIPEAIVQTNKILDYLTAHSIYGILSPFGAYLACVQALQAAAIRVRMGFWKMGGGCWGKRPLPSKTHRCEILICRMWRCIGS